jgi:hypothetical protein
VVTVIAIARTALSSAPRTRIHPVVIIIIQVDYIIPIQLSHREEVAWFVLPTTWQLNFALRGLLQYQEKRTPVRLTFDMLVVCGLERST